MKNDKIINAWDKMKPSDETKELIFNETIRKYEKSRRISFVRPRRILAVMVSVAVMVALFSMQAIIAFIGGLFFTPGVGATNEPIIYEGLEAPVEIETEYGIISLRFVTKITSNGKTSMGLQLYSLDVPAEKVTKGEYPVYVTISADGETIVSDGETDRSASGGSNGRNFVSYMYTCGDFPDISEFDLTILGVTTHITLTEQPDNHAESKPNHNITLAAYKFGGVTSMIATDVFDSSVNADDYYMLGYTYLRETYHGENGETFFGGTTFGSYHRESSLKYQINELYQNEIPVKSISCDAVSISYYRKEPLAVEIPVPKDGETIYVDIEIPIGSYTYKITEISRIGDIISYEHNACMFLSKNYPDPSYTAQYRYIGVPMDNKSSEWEQAVANCESFIQHVFFSYDPDSNVSEPQMGGGEIWDFDQDAETLTFYFKEAIVIQFGDFDVEFD